MGYDYDDEPWKKLRSIYCHLSFEKLHELEKRGPDKDECWKYGISVGQWCLALQHALRFKEQSIEE